jgi:large subunit ribosomal protein L30
MAKTANKTNKKLQIKLVKSLIGCSEAQRKVAKALGFTKKDQVVEHDNSPVIKGMINKISHLLEVTE